MAYQDIGSPINWWGGKGTMAIRIKSIFPRHTKYVEVFGGAGHILFQKDKSQVEVYNDLHDGLVTMFGNIKNPETIEELKRRLELTPMGRAEFDHCRDTWRDETDPIEKARKFYVTVNQSFSSGLKNWKAYKGCEGIAKNVSKFYSTINNRLEFAHKRLKDVTIENLDYRDLLTKHDGEDVLFYIDPPYVGETRTLQKGYDHEMTDSSLHRELVEILLRLKGKAILSGYDHPVYDKLIDNGWTKMLLGEYAKSSAFNKVGEKKTVGAEVLWINFKLGTANVTTISQEHDYNHKIMDIALEKMVDSKFIEPLIENNKDIFNGINKDSSEEELKVALKKFEEKAFDNAIRETLVGSNIEDTYVFKDLSKCLIDKPTFMELVLKYLN